MEIGHNLKLLRTEAKLSQTALAKKAGVSQQLISQIERGENVSTTELPALATALGVRIEEIDPSYDVGIEPTGKRVPLVSWVSAGNLREQPGIGPADIEKWIVVGDLPEGDWIALGVDGDSMNRIAPNGSTILVNRSQGDLYDEMFYVFSLASGDATFKQFRRKPDRLQPFSTNPDHFAIPGSEDIYVVGRVRRVITDV
jgi:transcriptional regulator with XRE-family HTH domain